MSGALASTALQIGRRYGAYGSAWTVVRPVGAGIAAGHTESVAGVVTAYALRNTVDVAGLALPQVTVATAPWRVVAPLGQDIQVEDVLISVLDPTKAFRVLLTPETDEGFVLTGLGVTQPPDLATAGAGAGAGAGYQTGLRIGAF